MLIVAKTDFVLTVEEYQKWKDLYKNMIDSGFLMADGRFTLYNSIDKNEKIEELKDNHGNQERY